MQSTTPGASDIADLAMINQDGTGMLLGPWYKSHLNSQRSSDLKELSIKYKSQLAADKCSLEDLARRDTYIYVFLIHPTTQEMWSLYIYT